jgi:cytochrome c oxidase subunit 1
MTTAHPPVPPAGGLPYDADFALDPPLALTQTRTRRLVLRWIWTSTAFLGIAGVLGLLLRLGQAEFISLDGNLWYAIMTAHGLGAFIAWAGFFLMGISWWVLFKCGFPIRSFILPELTYWTMVIGVLGIVVTTLLGGFGGSWVFLYPLAFNSSGQWSDLVTGVFSASVLLAGVSILAYCAGVLHTVISPALKAEKDTLGQRIGLAFGFGLLWPSRFKTKRGVEPYPVLPLAVNALDMFLATLPFALLLVFQIIQSADSGFSINTLLAGNLLWAFGHPVVYLLLFPAAATYYYLIPRYAGRPLVAGRAVAVSWLIALTFNLFVWAHHLYMNYPDGNDVQETLGTIMQPTTYALVLPSAMSLFSLAATIWRSDFQWNAASKFLIAGAISWLVAGLQGIINATSAFQDTLHNTLWVVGHFHNMAFLNMGLLIFGAMYAFLPELTGRPHFNERLGSWHLWGTVIGAYGWVVCQMWQGLDGAPRRWSRLPENYMDLTRLSLVFLAILVIAQIIFLVNLYTTLRRSPFDDPSVRQGPKVKQ